MRFDLQKIDERIQKLQEIRKIATDPQMATILTEFLSYEDDQSPPRLDALRQVSPSLEGPLHTNADGPIGIRPEETNDLVNEVVNGVEAPSNGSLWSRRR